MGDSHVRRIEEYRGLMDGKLNRGEIAVSFVYRGGAGLDFILCNMEQARGYDILIVMAGSNDLSRQAKRPYFEHCYRIIEERSRELGVRQTVITSFWPRKDVQYNRVALLHHQHMSVCLKDHPRMTYWSWDRRQPSRTYDSVHLHQHGYEKAVKYLIAPILWAAKRIQE